jgi:hypothetical protein
MSALKAVTQSAMPFLAAQPYNSRLLSLLLRPLAKFCVRHAIKIQDLIEGLKIELLRAAKEDLVRRKATITPSKLSIATGIRRREISRLEVVGSESSAPRNLVTRVIGLWQDDPQFRTKSGSPRVLSADSESNEFAALVRKASRELYPATVLFELERIGAVARSARGIKLLVENYLPADDRLKGFEFISKQIEDLLQCADRNLFSEGKLPHHQLYTEYDGIREEDALKVQKWFLQFGHELHRKVRSYLSVHDQDLNPRRGDSVVRRARVSFGSASYVDLEA